MFWMDKNEKWRDPNMSLNTLSEILQSNRTYVGDAFKQNTGMTFAKYLSKRRIDYVMTILRNLTPTFRNFSIMQDIASDLRLGEISKR